MLTKKYFYEQACTPHVNKYFVNGIRKGYFLEYLRKDHNAYVEYSPLSNITILDNKSYLLSRAYLYLFFRKFLLTKKTTINQSALITDLDIDKTFMQADDFIKQGYKCLKIKISNNIDYEIKRINKLACYNMSLRLDANKSLSYYEAYKLLQNCKNLSIEYIEEPLENNIYCSKLYFNTGINIAFDESFYSVDDIYFMAKNNIKYLIVKINRFDNLFSLIKNIKIAISLGIIPIFSTCFETEFSSSLVSMMIYYLNLTDYTHGISAYNYSLSLFDEKLFSCNIDCADALYFLKNFFPKDYKDQLI